MPFVKGQSGNPAGRPEGSVSLITRTIREIVHETFLELQSDPENNFKAFCLKYPREGMAICAKLIPSDIKAEITIPEGIKIYYERDPDCRPLGTDPESDTGILGEQGSL